MNCNTCRHWKPSVRKLNSSGRSADDGEQIGECRAAPPIYTKTIGGDFRVFTCTMASDYCGAWSAIPTIGLAVESPTVSVQVAEPAPVVWAPEPADPEMQEVETFKKRGRPKKVVDPQ